MKRTLTTVISLALLSGTALAADLPSQKAPVVAPPPPMWTGFYAGLNAGYNFGTNNNTQAYSYGPPNWLFDADNPPGQYFSLVGFGLAQSGRSGNTQSGFIGGGQIGYNYQWKQNIVIGFEADIQGTTTYGNSSVFGGSIIGGTTNAIANDILNTSVVGQTNINAGVNYLGTVRGRLGYLFTPSLLVYGTGGLSYGGVYANVSQTSVGVLSYVDPSGPANNGSIQLGVVGGGNQSQTLVGWTAGGGLEWMFMPNWSLKAEALYWDLGNMNLNLATLGPGIGMFVPAVVQDQTRGPMTTLGSAQVNYQGVNARVGVNYHFNFASAPIIAKF